MDVQQIPFTNQGQYTGKIISTLYKDTNTEMVWAEVDGDRICLRPFIGKYGEEFKSRFQTNTTGKQEFENLIEIFQKSLNPMYSTGYKTDKEISDLQEKDSSRAKAGNPFTGYAIWDKETKKTIGRISLGACYDSNNGDSQSGLILSEAHRGSMKGQEAVLLLATLICILVKQTSFKVGGKEGTSTIKRVTAATRDDNEKSKAFLKKIGFEWVRPLTKKENSEEHPRSLYAIEVNKVEEVMQKFVVDPSQIQLKGFWIYL